MWPSARWALRKANFSRLSILPLVVQDSLATGAYAPGDGLAIFEVLRGL